MRQDTEVDYDHIVWAIVWLKGQRCRIVCKISEMSLLIEIENGGRLQVGHLDIRKAKSPAVQSRQPRPDLYLNV